MVGGGADAPAQYQSVGKCHVQSLAGHSYHRGMSRRADQIEHKPPSCPARGRASRYLRGLPPAGATDEELLRLLDGALLRLKDPERNILLLRFHGQKSPRHAAEELGITLRAVRMHESRAVGALCLQYRRLNVDVKKDRLVRLLEVAFAVPAPPGLEARILAAVAERLNQERRRKP